MHAGCLVPRGHMHTLYDAQCLHHESANCVCAYLCIYLHRPPILVCCQVADVIILAYVIALMFVYSFVCLLVFSGEHWCRSGRELSLFTDCKEVLSVSV